MAIPSYGPPDESRHSIHPSIRPAPDTLLRRRGVGRCALWRSRKSNVTVQARQLRKR